MVILFKMRKKAIKASVFSKYSPSERGGGGGGGGDAFDSQVYVTFQQELP